MNYCKNQFPLSRTGSTNTFQSSSDDPGLVKRATIATVQIITTLFSLMILTLLIGCERRLPKANELIRIGAFDQAISLLDKEIQNSPGNKDAHLAMANCLASKYCNMVPAAKEISGNLISDEVVTVQRSQVKRKAIEFYNNALKIDPIDKAALYNLARFLRNEAEPQEFKEVYRRILSITGNTIDTQLLGFGTGETPLDWGIYKPILIQQPLFELRPETNRGTVIISKDNSTASLNTEGATSPIILKRYAVFNNATEQDRTVTFYFDTIDITDKEEELYKAVIFQNILWTDGRRYSPVRSELYEGLLFNRVLNEKEADLLASTPWLNGAGGNVIQATLIKLFTGKYKDSGSWTFMRDNPQYLVDTFLISVREKDYRNVKEVNEPPSVFKTAGGEDGKIVFNKVKARRYIRSAQRYAKVNRDCVVFGCGDAKYDEMLLRAWTGENAIPDEILGRFMAGKCYKGTPDIIVKALCNGGTIFVRKTYVGGKMVEVVRDRTSGKVVTFENSVLSAID